jgi:diguanylate cyclase (GGDEF)-like protein/PAS domain S-box-containing protein/putative nucleotidyltransferase with HDIG domain
MNLFWKIYLAIFVPFLLLAPAASYFLWTTQVGTARQELVAEYDLLGRLVAADVEDGYEQSRWPSEILSDLAQREKTLFWWVVADDGTIRLASDPSTVGTSAYARFPELEGRIGAGPLVDDTRQDDGVSVHPFQAGSQKGSFWLGFSTGGVARMRNQALHMNVYVALAAVLLVGAALWIGVRHYTRPIRELVRGAGVLGRGGLDHRIPVRSRDELGALAGALNQMAGQLQRTTVSRDYVDGILATMNDALIVLNPGGAIRMINRAASDLLGYREEDLIGRSASVLQPDFSGQVREGKYESRLRSAQGREVPVLLSCSMMRDQAGEPVRIVWTACDITDRKDAERKLAELATTDALTGLVNRRRFGEVLEAETERSRRYGTSLALLMIDIDQFKSINDTLGHECGDNALVEAAKVLRSECRSSDVAARYAGDEFMVLLPNTTAEQAVVVAERIRLHAAQCNASDGRRTMNVGLSVGAAAIGLGSDLAPEQLLAAVDEALYAAKDAGRGCTRTWTPNAARQPADSAVNGAAVKVLERRVGKLSARSKDALLEELQGLVQALDARDSYTRCHSENVTLYATAVARTMGMADDEVEVIRRAGMMHDIGKIGVPDAILLNTGPLSDPDRHVMQQHPLIGVRILGQMHGLEREIAIVRHHHARWDGGGYPDGVSGTAIPLGARVLAVADSFDAITSDRVYRKGVSQTEAVQRLVSESGKQFDPVVVDALLKWLDGGGRPRQETPEEALAARQS